MSEINVVSRTQKLLVDAPTKTVSVILTGPPGAPASSRVVLAADVTNNNVVANTLADVTGLEFLVEANLLYHFRFVLLYTAAAATTGARFSVNGPAKTTLTYTSETPSSTTAMIKSNNSDYNMPSAAGSASNAAGSIGVVEGFVKPSSSGLLIARFASEVASSAVVVKAGSFVEYKVVA